MVIAELADGGVVAAALTVPAFGAAAPYALMMIALAVVPGTLLGLWFDRERHTRPALAS